MATGCPSSYAHRVFLGSRARMEQEGYDFFVGSSVEPRWGDLDGS